MIPIMLRGMLPRVLMVALLCVAFFFIEPGFHTHEAAPEEFRLDLGALGISATLSNLAGLSMLILLGGFVSNDRRQGYYRLFFSHPTRPLAFYALRWAMGLAMAMLAAAAFLVIGQLVAWGRFEGGWIGLYLALLAAVANGGMIAFLSVTLSRGDTWVALVLFLFNYFWLLAISAGAQPLPGPLGDILSIVLPPQLAFNDVYDGLVRGEIVWGASAFAAGYGVFWLLLAGLVLKLRDWP
ncbi:MAG TPA: hypothetical protein VGC13_21520 [Longimicrobium sp.]|jgi:hypothetical protein|uniref:hypothetical protein n=1 Tax=Longimicrobium sp. TaxID=2029185 RepID=UPI002EDA4D7A